MMWLSFTCVPAKHYGKVEYSAVVSIQERGLGNVVSIMAAGMETWDAKHYGKVEYWAVVLIQEKGAGNVV